MDSETRITSVYSYDGPPHLELFREEAVAGDGSARVRHHIVAQHGVSGAVVIAEREGALCFVVMERPHAGGIRLELPRGFGDPDDMVGGESSVDAEREADTTAVNTASREFREETGLRLAEPRVVGRFVVDSNLYPQPVAVVRGLCPDDGGRLADGEAMATRWVAASEVDAKVARGEISDAITLAALAMWRAWSSAGT